ncbi:caffeic acid 3-O-methyltransferase-like [Chenopodium quinoa]|uniref:caffeic acid 3-O-methyltransferase-like n=1 Tax=Chenopodium quinoa TaxID=63459 RepID=UPI000B77178A|nr:caffeic acid 3-O-methyltransferase-like [Chenopodium quinoa]
MATSSTSKTNEGQITDQMNEEELDYLYTYQLINSCVLPMVMKVTIETGVLQLINDQAGLDGLSPAEIATRVQILNPNAPAMLDRMLCLLATYDVIGCTVVDTADGVERRYSPSRVTKFLVPDNDGVSLGPLLNLFVDKIFIESWSKLKEAVVEGGIPFNMAHGVHAFEYPSLDARFNEVFNKAMYQSTTFTIKKILDKYKGFEGIETLVDVGGGLGHTLRVIISQYPSIKAITFDLPHVIENALPFPGVEHVCGDMFESIPKGDVIFMKWVLHDWSDEHCLKLLKNCFKALPENGKVIAVEGIMVDKPDTTVSAKVISQRDLLMMTQNPGGKERSKHEFEALAKAAGFATINFVCCVYNLWVMEFYK